MHSARARFSGLLLAVTVLLGMTACEGGQPTAPTPDPTPTSIAGSVVSTAGSTNEQQIVWPADVRNQWSGISGGAGLEWVNVDGTGQTTAQPTLVTSTEEQDALATRINDSQSAAPGGRSALAGLDKITSPAGTPVWVVSPMLDTMAPLDFRELAFDESPASVVKALKKADALPDLKGRQVTFVVTGPAGEQQPLSKLQAGYQHAVWEGIAKAAGAKGVAFIDGDQAGPRAGTIPVVPVPKPGELSEKTEGDTKTCTLPSPALFVADQATLIDRAATKKALQKCVGETSKATKIVVEGHTAGSAGTDNAFAKRLSTQRATEVAAVLKEMKVPAGNIEKVVGYGSEKPLVKPGTDPRNRAVVVTFTTKS